MYFNFQEKACRTNTVTVVNILKPFQVFSNALRSSVGVTWPMLLLKKIAPKFSVASTRVRVLASYLVRSLVVTWPSCLTAFTTVQPPVHSYFFLQLVSTISFFYGSFYQTFVK